MLFTGPLSHALSLSSGAHFYRCALQVNPHHYAETYRGQISTVDDKGYIRTLIDKALKLNVRVLAVTDHNHVGGIDKIRVAAEEHHIYLFPGFEITSSEGVHILCIYPLNTTVESLNRYLGEFGVRDTDPSPTPCSKSFTQILQIVLDQGGITIAAHVTQKHGLLFQLQGQPRVNAWKDRNLLAVQIPSRVEDLPENLKQIICNQNADHRRDPSRAPDLAIAVVNAKDIAKPEDLDDPSATCWIKMSEASTEGLRQAFLDPISRIRLNTDPPLEEHAEFVAMTWQGGFLDESAIYFNENLNILIGGRGTGKSTVIESLRYVLGLEPLGEDARKAHEGIVHHVLKGGTKISLLVRSHRPAKNEYLIERTVPNPAVVRDESGKVLPLMPTDVIPQVEVYGQHELSELTKSPEKLTRLLGRFIERDPTLGLRKSELKDEFERSRSRILDTQRDLSRIEERLARLPVLEETVRRFQDAGLEERLKEQSLLIREERILTSIPERLTPFREMLDQIRRELPMDRTFVSPRALEELPGKNILAGLDTILERLSQDLVDVVSRVEQALQRADEGLNIIRGHWEERKHSIQAAYEAILRELQRSKVDGEEFIRLRRQIEELRPLKEHQVILQRNLKEQEDHRHDLLVEWEDIKAEEFRQLERASKKVNQQLANRVRVKVTFAGNREPLFQFLRNSVGGRLSEAIDKLRELDALSLKELADAWRGGRDALVQKFGISSVQADRLAQASLEVIMQIEELDLPATTEIELNVAGEKQPPVWQVLEDLSTGQKATAVLLLLLLESDAPLVVDQPEDDLDNRFITEGIVPKMREEKRRRQFVFTTHNANIPVLGDAELIVGLSASGEAGYGKARIPAEHMGAIDARPVRELVEEILEGGREAFEVRRLKYGF
ncbi:MAG: AAA family ATPase [Candidatus Tectomicrobia bacterium]|nr:AAA family ATPase [Candidatus Tectomicrobia bacterium]